MSAFDSILQLCRRGLTLAEQFLAQARHATARQVQRDGRVDAALVDIHQLAAHGFAWQATYVEALRQSLLWATGLRDAGRLTAVEAAMLRLGFAEFLAQIGSGSPMSQTEIVRPGDIGIDAEATHAFLRDPVLAELNAPEALAAARQTVVAAATVGNFGDVGLADETIAAIRDQFLRYAASEIAPHAQGWHQRDELIPQPVVEQLAAMGVFGLTVSEDRGGAG